MYKYLILILLLATSAFPYTQVGNTDVATGGSTNYANYMVWVKCTMPSTGGYLDSFVIYGYGASSDVSMAIYTAAGDGTPNEVIDSCAAVALPGSWGWVQGATIVGAQLKADSVYWLAAQATGALNMYYDFALSQNLRRKAITPIIAWPNPADDDGGSDLDFSFYAVIHPGSTADTLFPTSDISVQWTDLAPAGDNYVEVDDQTADGTGSYVYVGINTKTDHYGLSDGKIPSGATIDSVVTVVNTKYTDISGDAPQVFPFLYYNSTQQNGTNITCTADYTEYKQQIACPSGAWNDCDFDGLSAGITSALGIGDRADVTQLIVIVYYQPPASSATGQVIIIQ